MIPTGRTVDDPLGQLVELKDAEGQVHTALAMEGPASRTTAKSVELVLSFLEYPMVTGLAELSHHALEHGVFIYPTGSSLTMLELQRRHAEVAKVMGLKAALELGKIAADILADAVDVGEAQACFSHGDLSPRRVLVGRDGRVLILGYGLPPPAMVLDLDDPVSLPGDVLRYSPPERLEGHAEDGLSDVYSLAAIVFEVATGRPLFPGHDGKVVRDRIVAGDGPRAVRGAGLPRTVADLLARALSMAPSARPRAREFSHSMHELLDSSRPQGEPLSALLQSMIGGRAVAVDRRAPVEAGRPRLAPTDTSALPFRTLASPVPRPEPHAESPAPEPTPSGDLRPTETPVPSRSRWEQVTAARPSPESAGGPASPGGPPVPEPTPPPLPRRRRRKLEPGPRGAAATRSEATGETPTERTPKEAPESPRARRARRKASRRTPSPAARAAALEAESAQESGPIASKPEPAAPSEAKPPSKPTPPPATPTRRASDGPSASPQHDTGGPPAPKSARRSPSPAQPSPTESPTPTPPPQVSPRIAPERSEVVPVRRRLTRSGTLAPTSRRRFSGQSPDEPEES